MKKIIFITFLAVILAACVSATTPAPTETPIPTFTFTPVRPTFTPTIMAILPTPLPTQPTIPVITPDAIQVERWEEYQTALAKTFFPSSFIPGQFLCEWEILGRSDQEVYVWAVCMSTFSVKGIGVPYEGDMPAVLHINSDGIVQSVEVPGGGSSYASDIRRMFPLDAQERYFGKLIPFQELIDHLRWRREHTEELPLIVLSATPTVMAILPTPLPTLPPIGMTPDPTQVERWKEYQTELAKVLLYGYGPDAYKDALCEWDILGRSSQEVYVWAYCSLRGGEGGDIPTVIHLKDDGTVQNVEVPSRGSMWDSDIKRMFPSVVQEKFGIYTGISLFYGRIKEMIAHIDYREAHPEEPPLVVILATPIPTPTP